MSLMPFQKLGIDIDRNFKTGGDNPNITKTDFVVISRAVFATLKRFPTYPKLFESV